MKSTTPSFITELPLKTTSSDESTILVRLDLIRQSKDFQEIQKFPKTIDGEPNKKRTDAFQKKAFGIAKNVRFKGKNQFDSLEGKNNDTGLMFENNTLTWSGLEIPCIIDEKNEVIACGLQHWVKYCRLVQLILEGTPYQNPENKKKRRLQRKMDRSLRAKSNRYKATCVELSETDRKLAAHRKSIHGRDINVKSATIISEAMDVVIPHTRNESHRELI